MLNNIADDDSPMDISEATGRLYRYTAEGLLARVCDDFFGITNTLVFVAPNIVRDGRHLANMLYAYRIEPGTGRLSDREVTLARFPARPTRWVVLDSEGFVRNVRVAGGGSCSASRPTVGSSRVVDLPCSWPTSCAFGGPGLATLFVTSARFTMTADHLAAEPQEGGLFAVDVGVAACPRTVSVRGARLRDPRIIAEGSIPVRFGQQMFAGQPVWIVCHGSRARWSSQSNGSSPARFNRSAVRAMGWVPSRMAFVLTLLGFWRTGEDFEPRTP